MASFIVPKESVNLGEDKQKVAPDIVAKLSTVTWELVNRTEAFPDSWESFDLYSCWVTRDADNSIIARIGRKSPPSKVHILHWLKDGKVVADSWAFDSDTLKALYESPNREISSISKSAPSLRITPVSGPPSKYLKYPLMNRNRKQYRYMILSRYLMIWRILSSIASEEEAATKLGKRIARVTTERELAAANTKLNFEIWSERAKELVNELVSERNELLDIQE